MARKSTDCKRQSEQPLISYVQEMGGSSYAGDLILQRVSVGF